MQILILFVFLLLIFSCSSIPRFSSHPMIGHEKYLYTNEDLNSFNNYLLTITEANQSEKIEINESYSRWER